MTSHDGDRIVFRSRFNKGLSIVAWVLSAIMAGSLLFSSTPATLVFAVIPALGAYLAWLLFWGPAVVVSDEAVTIVNATRTIEVPWEAVTQVETKYSLTIRTANASYGSLAAPAPGAFGTYTANRDLRVKRNSDVVDASNYRRPSDLSGSDSGLAAQLVVDRWNRLGDERRILVGVTEAAPVTIHWHFLRLAGLVVLASASVAVIANF